jgi:hypothetical protein
MFRTLPIAFSGRAAGAAAVCLLISACAGTNTAPPAPPAASAEIAIPVSMSLARPRLERRDLPALHDLSDQQLVQRLGKPDFTRKEADAEIWQYRGDKCVLVVFLYPEEGALKVAHAATRDRTALKTPENSCTPFGAPLTASAGS